MHNNIGRRARCSRKWSGAGGQQLFIPVGNYLMVHAKWNEDEIQMVYAVEKDSQIFKRPEEEKCLVLGGCAT
jgi:hypothetical protein